MTHYNAVYKRLGFGSVGRAFRLLQHSARYFREAGIPLARLVALLAATRLARFLAFLLPFKVLMFMVAGRGIHIAGYEFGPTEVAGILLAFAVILFLTQLGLTRLYDNRIGTVFGDVTSDEAVEEFLHHGQEVRAALTSVINIRAAAFLGIALFVANIFLFPPSFVMLLPIGTYLSFVMYAMARPSYEKPLVPGNHNAVIGFLSMVAVLVLLGSTVLTGREVHFVLALFVFISFRYITNCLTEISSILYRYRLGVMPAFLRNRIEDHVKADLKVASGPPPFLSTNTKNAWLRSALDEIGARPNETLNAVWNHSVNTQSFGFIAYFNGSSPVLINIFQPSGRAAFLQEQSATADFAGASFLLPKLGQARKGQFSVIAYDLSETEPIKQDEFQGARQNLTIEMLKMRPPQLPRMKMSNTDALRWLTAESLDTLRAVSPDRASEALVDWLQAHCSPLREQVLRLPLALYVANLQPSLLRRHGDGIMKVLSWNGADLEPIGAGLGPVEARRNLSIDGLLQELKAHRDDCGNVSVNDIELSARLFTLARYVKRRDWTRVFAAISALREVFTLNDTCVDAAAPD